MLAVMDHLKEVKSICRGWRVDLKSHRVYIPKSGGRVRPLGVPDLPWRVVTSAFSYFISFSVDGKRTPSQFGFRPDRSIAMAWLSILREVIPSETIFEYDLKSFFNSIRLGFLNFKLDKFGIPDEVIEWIHGVNCNNPKPPVGVPIHESDPELANPAFAASRMFSGQDAKFGGWENQKRIMSEGSKAENPAFYFKDDSWHYDPSGLDLLDPRSHYLDVAEWLQESHETLMSKVRGVPQGLP